MLTLRQARIRTSRFYRFIDDDGMTVCLDVFRIAITANRASICTHAFLRTSRLFCHAALIFVTVCGNNFLFYEYFTADGAVLALRQARIRTSRFYRFINYFCMRGHRNAFRIAITADRASVCALARLRASGLLSHFARVGMTESFHIVAVIRSAADRTGVDGIAVCRTGRCDSLSRKIFVLAARNKRLRIHEQIVVDLLCK